MFLVVWSLKYDNDFWMNPTNLFQLPSMIWVTLSKGKTMNISKKILNSFEKLSPYASRGINTIATTNEHRHHRRHITISKKRNQENTDLILICESSPFMMWLTMKKIIVSLVKSINVGYSTPIWCFPPVGKKKYKKYIQGHIKEVSALFKERNYSEYISLLCFSASLLPPLLVYHTIHCDCHRN